MINLIKRIMPTKKIAKKVVKPRKKKETFVVELISGTHTFTTQKEADEFRKQNPGAIG